MSRVARVTIVMLAAGVGKNCYGITSDNQISSDCRTDSIAKAGFTRVYIAATGKDGSGKSAADPRDGSSVEKFDRILRCYSEGCSDPATPGHSVPKTENLIVCLAPGTFHTKGSYDYVVNAPHKSQEGFTVGKGWKVHGAGADQTTVQLSAYFANLSEPNPENVPVGTGTGVVFSTNSDDASGIEISDLAVDANYPELKRRAQAEDITALNLQAIHLRSDRGGHWIHDVNVVNTSGEIANISIKWETFPVWIYSVRPNSSPADNKGNIIERVRMSSYGGGQCTAIAIANAVGEIRNNSVEGYQIGYGGWTLGAARFHDNVATGTEYGFNIDSLTNNGVVIENNQINHPRKYGIVVGGSGTYSGFIIRNNTIRIDKPGVVGLLFQGNVTNAGIAGNTIVAEAFPMQATAIKSFSSGRAAGANRNNAFQGNKISERLKITFNRPSRREDNCASGNRDENGRPLRDLPDNSANTCGIPNDSATP